MVRMKSDQSGQALLEYMILLFVAVSMFLVLMDALGKTNIASKILSPLNGDFAHAYRYGHPKALGYDDGGPKQHPRATDAGSDNFRIFYAAPP